MTDELLAFKSFVAAISPDWPEEIIAEALGEAKAYWAEAALSLNCVRVINTPIYRDPEGAEIDMKSVLANLVGPQEKIRRI